MTRWLVMLAVALALSSATHAGAQSRGEKAQKAPAAQKAPLHLYLAKGEADACGEGCSEWIAAEGYFDSGAAGRVSAFLKRQGGRKLPIYFHSPGGDGMAAMAMGRQLRQLGVTMGVGKTIPRRCTSAADQSDACRAAKRSTQAVASDWRPDGICNSACVYALIGAKVRHVPPAARVGVHAARTTMFRKYSDGRVQQVSPNQAPALINAKAAEFDAQLRRYVRDMGIDVRLFETSAKVPHEDIYYLSRDQIAAFGIDRREYADAPWFVSQFSNNTSYVSKWIVEARGPGRKDYRVSVVLFTCSSAHHASIRYLRGLASDEVGRPVTAIFSIGKHTARFSLKGNGTREDAIDTGTLFSSSSSYVAFDDVEAAAAHGAIGVIEADPRADTQRPRVIELSTQGLVEGIKVLRDKCTASTQPAPGPVAGTRAPWVPVQTVPPSFPATP
jgi:hypothetical protein